MGIFTATLIRRLNRNFVGKFNWDLDRMFNWKTNKNFAGRGT